MKLLFNNLNTKKSVTEASVFDLHFKNLMSHQGSWQVRQLV